MAYWLLKTEPEEYSFADLQRQGRDTWDGVRNPQALKNIRSMAPGDGALIYHSGKERSAVGLARVVTDPYPDPNAGDPKVVVVDVEAGARLGKPVKLSVLRDDATFDGSPLLQQARLSVVPLTEDQWKRVLELGGKD